MKGLQIMCGIAGFVNDMPIDVKCPVLQRMTDMIAHRGPDSEGHYIDEHAALGHRRLSIIALGGGSAMDAGKIMWVMYEHPEVDFLDMAMRFMDIRKRVYTFPKMGEKAYFVAIPTTAGTGSEVTPFAVITDETTGGKDPLAGDALRPTKTAGRTPRLERTWRTPPAWPVWPSPTPSWACATPWRTSWARSIICPTALPTP